MLPLKKKLPVSFVIEQPTALLERRVKIMAQPEILGFHTFLDEF